MTRPSSRWVESSRSIPERTRSITSISSTPWTVEPTGTDGETDADDTDDGSEDGTDVTTQTGDVTAVAPSESKFPTKLLAIGGIVAIGGIAAMKMGKRGV